MEITQEEILKKYEELPEDLKRSMYSVATAEMIYAIGQKFGLNVEQTGDLTTEIAKIILGMNHPKNFISGLSEVLDIPREKAVEVAQEVNHKIFFPIREELKKLHGIGISSELTPSVPSELPKHKEIEPETEEPKLQKPVQITPKETYAAKIEEIPKTIMVQEIDKQAKKDEATSEEQEKTQTPSWIKPKETEEKPQTKPIAEDKYREPID